MSIFKRRTPPSPPTDSWILPSEGPALPRDFVADRLNFARRHADWYRRKKRGVQIVSKTLRFAAIIFLTVGGMIPLIAQTGLPVHLEYGYISFLLGGTCLLSDRIFGISTGWARYMVAALDIEALVENFRAQVVEIECKEHSGSGAVIVDLCRTFTENINIIIGAETNAWLQELSNSNEELSKIVSSRNHWVEKNRS